MAKVAINGLGRIGRAVLKLVEDEPSLELAAVNDLTPLDNLVYLLRYDSVYGHWNREVGGGENALTIGSRSVPAFGEKDPARLPWKKLGIDIVFECTGAFRQEADLARHLDAGAGHAILSAPAKGGDVFSVVHGVNELPADRNAMFSTASCTTNCIAPVAEIMARRIGVKKAVMSTIHAYTSSQGIVDSPNKRMERGRAGATNIIPTSTGAASATIAVLPHFADRFDGLAIRVPVPVVSLVDMTVVAESRTTREAVNGILREESQTPRYQGVLGVSDDPIVSTDIIGDPRASVVDLLQTLVVDGDLVKVLAWYDNEWGYASQMVRQARSLAA